MLKALVEFSLRFRGVVIAVALVVAAYGSFIAAHAKLDVFPEFAPPQVVIQTEAPGLSPEEVETLVTRPIESAVSGAGSLESIRSQSIQGFSLVVAIFAEGTDVLRARNLVNERLLAAELPPGVKIPKMAPLTSSTSLALVVGLTSKTRTPMELRTFADWTLRPRLKTVTGVASVVEFGGEVRQLQVQVKPDRLQAYDLAITDVIDAAREATGVRGAGFIENENQRIPVRAEGQPKTPEEIGEVAVAHREGLTVRLKDVATVAEGPEPKLGDAAINGDPGVLLLVWSQFGSNTMEVTEAVEAALDEMKPAFASNDVVVHASLFRPANFITSSIRNVNHSLMVGGGLVAIVLVLFLLDLRTAFISFTSIPLSLLAAVIVLDRAGASINTMTLGGFAIAIGVVVDDAIIDVENIVRRLRENRLMAAPRPIFDVVLDASLEVRSAVVYATFIVALVFLPVLTMTGVQGKLFSPLGVSFILATLASLATALTLTPALCFVMLARARLGEPPYIRAMKRAHVAVLRGLLSQPVPVIGTALLLCAGAGAMLTKFGTGFLPEFREGHFIIHMNAVPGTSLPASMRQSRAVAAELLKNPHLQSASVQCGRAEEGEDTVGTDFSEFVVAVKNVEGEEAEAVEGEIRKTMEKFPGVTFDVKTFLAERIEETISGVTAEVVIKIYGDDLDAIDAKAKDVAKAIKGVSGAVDVRVQSPPGVPELVVRLRGDRLKQFGFTPVKVLDALETAYQGFEVAQVFEKTRVFDVSVILDPDLRRDPERLGELTLRNPDGVPVPLSQLADLYLSEGRPAILHDATQRYQAVTCNVRGRDLGSFVAEAKRKISGGVKFPAGVYPVFTGSAEAEKRARQELVLHAAIAGAGIVLLLAVVFGNFRNLMLVLSNLPFALVGGVLAVYVTDKTLSVGSMVGFVTLFGITMRNSIMMVSHFDHLVASEGMTWGVDAALRGASERLVPILMTALVTALGLLPIALGSGEAGREIEGPMALVILGGLATSTLLNLLVLPTLALRFGHFEKPVESQT